MKQKISSLLTLCLLGGFLVFFGLWEALRTPDALSQSERRQLTQFPTPTVKTVLDGSFMSQTESWASDQFPLRDSFRTVKAVTSLYLLRQRDNNGVYLADGYASQLEYPMDTDSLDHAAERFRYLYDRYLKDSGGALYLSVIPDKNAFLAEENGYPHLDYAEFTDALRERTPFLTYIDLTGVLSISNYYCTDLHWRQETLLPVADLLLSQMKATPHRGAYTENTLDVPYYGVYYGYAALPLPAEEIHYLTGEALDACTVYNYETGETTGLYDMEKAHGRDPYEMFLSGSVSLLRIDNPNADPDKKLVIFRDSFSSSLAPLLAEGYSSVTLIDIRYLASARLGQLVDFTGQDVLFLYSVPVLNHSETLQ